MHFNCILLNGIGAKKKKKLKTFHLLFLLRSIALFIDLIRRFHQYSGVQFKKCWTFCNLNQTSWTMNVYLPKSLFRCPIFMHWIENRLVQWLISYKIMKWIFGDEFELRECVRKGVEIPKCSMFNWNEQIYQDWDYFSTETDFDIATHTIRIK